MKIPLIIFFLSSFNCYSQIDDFVTLSVETQWNILIDQHDCIAGGDKYSRYGKETGALYVRDFKLFLTQSKDIIVPFLIQQISDTTKTRLHTCPNDDARRGELAIYCLQIIYKVSWCDISKDYTKFIIKEDVAFEDTRQDWILEIISDPRKSAIMKQNWMKICKNK